jgi:hypothetical protein
MARTIVMHPPLCMFRRKRPASRRGEHRIAAVDAGMLLRTRRARRRADAAN